MLDITHLNGVALVKKKGNKLYVVSDPEDVADESPIIAEGTTTPRMLTERFADVVNVRDFGAVGNGTIDDTEAIKAAFLNASYKGKTVLIPSGIYKVTDLLQVPDSVNVIGDGYDFWDLKGSWKPRRMQRGTTLLFCGSPSTTVEIQNVSNMRVAGGVVANDAASSTNEDFDGNSEYSLLDYTNGDSTGALPATPKKLKVAIALGNNSKLRKLRVQLNYNGVDGYNSAESLVDFPEYQTSYPGLGDDWDIGVLSHNVDRSGVEDCQVVGYWRMTARACIASNYGQGRTSPGCIFYDKNFFYQGFVGLSIRSNDVHRITAITSSTVEIPWNASHTVPTSGILYINGLEFTYTSSTKIGDKLQLSGFDEDISSAGTVGDECSFGTNTGIAGASLADGFIAGLGHFTNRRAYDSTLSSPSAHPSMAHEISGNPLRDVEFINVHFFDTDVIGFLHDAMHIAYLGCYAEAQGFSGNTGPKGARFIASCRPELEDANGTYPAGNVRGLYFDKASEMSDGSVDLYPMHRPANGRFNGETKYFMPDQVSLFCIGYWVEEWDSTRRYDIGARLFCQGPNKTFDITDESLNPLFSLKGNTERIGLGISNPGASIHRKGLEATFLLETEGTADPAINLRNGEETQNTWAIRPQQSSVNQLQVRYDNSVRFQVMPDTGTVNAGTDNVASIGTATVRYSTVYAATGTINTSDYRCKQNIANPTQALLKAWGNVGFKVFQFKDAVEKKGESSARYHVGVIAQDVQTAFTEQGLDASKYGLFCHDSWEDEYETIEVVDQPEVLNEAGEVVTPAVVHTEQCKVLDAGDRYGVRYEEALALECAYLRNRLSKIETALTTHGIILGDE